MRVFNKVARFPQKMGVNCVVVVALIDGLYFESVILVFSDDQQTFLTGALNKISKINNHKRVRLVIKLKHLAYFVFCLTF